MAKVKEIVKEQEQEPIKIKKYGKNAFVNADEFSEYSELLSVLLVNGVKYSKQEVHGILFNFLEKGDE